MESVGARAYKRGVGDSPSRSTPWLGVKPSEAESILVYICRMESRNGQSDFSNHLGGRPPKTMEGCMA